MTSEGQEVYERLRVNAAFADLESKSLPTVSVSLACTWGGEAPPPGGIY